MLMLSGFSSSVFFGVSFSVLLGNFDFIFSVVWVMVRLGGTFDFSGFIMTVIEIENLGVSGERLALETAEESYHLVCSPGVSGLTAGNVTKNPY